MFTMEHVAGDEDEAGITLGDIGRALCLWASMNSGSDTSVRRAAAVFATTDEVIRAAVGADPWAFLAGPDDDPTKQTIEVDGE